MLRVDQIPCSKSGMHVRGVPRRAEQCCYSISNDLALPLAMSVVLAGHSKSSKE